MQRDAMLALMPLCCDLTLVESEIHVNAAPTTPSYHHRLYKPFTSTDNNAKISTLSDTPSRSTCVPTPTIHT